MRMFVLDVLAGLIQKLEAAHQELSEISHFRSQPRDVFNESVQEDSELLQKRIDEIRLNIRQFDPKYYMKAAVGFTDRTPQVRFTHSQHSYDRRDIHKENFRKLSKTDRKVLKELKFPITSLRVFNRRI